MSKERTAQGTLWDSGSWKAPLSRADYLVLSLQEEPWSRIVSGIKKYEYRRKFRDQRSVCFVYVTTPVSAVSGVILLDRPIQGSAAEIGDLAEKQIPGNGKPVFEYLEPGGRGCALPIRAVQTFAPVPLATLKERFAFVPPQLYISLDKKPDLFAFLLQQSKIENVERPDFTPDDW